MIILDNGHGDNTAGKRSPVWSDGLQLLEWEFNRDIVRRIANWLRANSVQYKILVPEITDTSLTERVKRANNLHSQNSILISVHANAGGGTGWEAHTSPNKTKSDELSSIFYSEAGKRFGWGRLRKGSNDKNDPDWDSPFTILTKTKMPAILTENFFMDTEQDCRFIMSESGRQEIAEMHISAIKRILQ